MSGMCGDNRFEIIGKAKEHLIECTNIGTSQKEMDVIDNFLFRCWQMGWLDKYGLEKEKDVPEHSYIKSEYVCGRKPKFNIGDRFSWHCHCYIPGETDYDEETGCVTKVVFKEGDWVYIFDDDDEMTEESLIRLNAKVCQIK